MRVITGCAKGAKLQSIDSLATRPTLDRIKETMFNIIPYYFDDLDILDIFSGSGALGIEALSRGARSCEFVDSNDECCKVIKENLEHTKLIDKANITNGDVFKTLLMFTNKQKFDIKFHLVPLSYLLCCLASHGAYKPHTGALNAGGGISSSTSERGGEGRHGGRKAVLF